MPFATKWHAFRRLFLPRYVSENIVALGFGSPMPGLPFLRHRRCWIDFDFHPDTFGTGKISEEKLVTLVRVSFRTCAPKASSKCSISCARFVVNPAAYGHFGAGRTWDLQERTDKAAALRRQWGCNSGLKIKMPSEQFRRYFSNEAYQNQDRRQRAQTVQIVRTFVLCTYCSKFPPNIWRFCINTFFQQTAQTAVPKHGVPAIV